MKRSLSILATMRFAAVLAAVSPAFADEQPKAPTGPPPAKVEKAIKETDFNTVTLTPQAEQRLGITTVAVERKSVPRTRLFGGEAVLRAGASQSVSAPIAATVRLELPKPGARVRQGQELAILVPILSPVERVNVVTAHADAQASLGPVKAQLDAARVTLVRAEQLVKTQAGSQRAVDDARAAVALGEANVKAIEARVAMLASVLKDYASGNVTALTVNSPLDGVVMNVRSAAGQQVSAGGVLLELASLDPLWLRVPVYGGDAASLQPGASATVSSLGAKRGDLGIECRPVNAPPSANASAATVDFYFELPNSGGKFRPGERVSVSLPLTTAENSLVVPWAAVLHDIHGGQWVYEQTAPQTYARRRVTVERVAGRDAVLASGPPVGTKLVTAGAAELFGTELGIGK